MSIKLIGTLAGTGAAIVAIIAALEWWPATQNYVLAGDAKVKTEVGGEIRKLYTRGIKSEIAVSIGRLERTDDQIDDLRGKLKQDDLQSEYRRDLERRLAEKERQFYRIEEEIQVLEAERDRQ